MLEKELNEKFKEAGIKHALHSRDEIAKTVQETMDLIDLEITKNHDIYPENGGKLGQRELCRRAGIHYQTLQQPAHKSTTRIKVMSWLAAKETKTKRETKKAVAEKIDYWEEQHRMIADQIHVYELELNERDVEIVNLRATHKKETKALEDEINRLKSENSGLREQVTKVHKKGNVTPLRHQEKYD